MATLLEIYEAHETGQKGKFYRMVQAYGAADFTADVGTELADGVLHRGQAFAMLHDYVAMATDKGALAEIAMQKAIENINEEGLEDPARLTDGECFDIMCDLVVEPNSDKIKLKALRAFVDYVLLNRKGIEL